MSSAEGICKFKSFSTNLGSLRGLPCPCATKHGSGTFEGQCPRLSAIITRIYAAANSSGPKEALLTFPYTWVVSSSRILSSGKESVYRSLIPSGGNDRAVLKPQTRDGLCAFPSSLES